MIHPDEKSDARSNNFLLRRVVVISTALCLLITFGWLACLGRDDNGELDFRWRWGAVIWIFIGIACSVYFWNQLWPRENSIAVTRQRIIRGSIVLAIPCLWWICYPLWFISRHQISDVFIGLALAAAVLTVGAFMMVRLAKAISKDENAADENNFSSAANPKNKK